MKKSVRLCIATVALFLLSLSLSAQVDTIFWFAVPEITQAHADRPVALRLSAADLPSQVRITVPAQGLVIATLTVNSGVSSSIDLTPFVDSLENLTPNLVRNWGLQITATEPITAYYEITPSINTEIITLKGKNGMGTRFITPFQTRYPNNSGFNGECWSSADIVATENNTSIVITPSTGVVGHARNVPYTILLNKGQTYSIRDSLRTKNTGNMSGTLITSDKKISVTIKDDGVEVPGLLQSYNDVVGDQLMSFENVGRQYIAIKGEMSPNDYIYVVGTANGTNVMINGVASVINDRQTIEASFTQNIYISADQPVYAYHLTGSQSESGSAILPNIECTGSSSISFTRGNSNKSVLLIAVPTTATGNFLMNGNATLIPASAFTVVPGSPGWSAAKINLSASMIVGSNTVTNTRSLFHLALVNGDNGSGGSAYGYFSNYKSEISAGKDSTICAGSTIRLPDPGVYYSYEYTVLHGDATSITGTNTVKPNQTTTYLLRRLGSCPATDTVVVTVNDLKADAGNDTTICTGIVRIGGTPAASGGKAPYTYLWNSGQTTDFITAGAGTHSLTVTDNMGCKSSDAMTVTLAPPLVVRTGTSPVRCFGETNGKAFVQSVSGGSSPFTYSWNGTAGSDTITTASGTQQLKITDAKGCSATATVTITQPARLDLDTVVVPASCPQVANARVNCTASGGTSPYNYSRTSDPFTGSGSFTGLSAGSTYRIRVKDVNGCLDSVFVTPSAGTPPIVSTSNDTTVCPGDSVTLYGYSTTSGLNYTWTNGVSNGVRFKVNAAGKYVVTGTDANGCAGSDSLLINIFPVQPVKINSVPGVICSDTGTIQLVATGPVSGWEGTGVHSVTGLLTVLPGSVIIVCTGGNQCKTTDTLRLTVTPRSDARIHAAGPFCTVAGVQQLGSVQSGGNWSGPGTSSSGQFDPSAAGTGNHPVIYIIPSACPDADTVAILVNSSFDPSILPSGPYCAGEDTVLLPSVTPGASWSGTGITDAQSGVFDPRIAGPGNHIITHTIAGSCGGTDSRSITVLPADTVHIQLPNDSVCHNAIPVQLSADRTGGSWSGAVGINGTFDPAGKIPGSYVVRYNFVQQCPYTDSVRIIIPDTLKATMNGSTVNCFGDVNGQLQLIPVNGSAPFAYSWTDNALANTPIRTNLAPSAYTAIVTDALGCSATATANVTQPTALILHSILPVNDSCHQAFKGSVTFSVSGGTPFTSGNPYRYQLNPSAGLLNPAGNGFTGLGFNTYNVTATDGNGCVVNGTFTITEPQRLSVVASGSPDHCGQQLGIAQHQASSGGTPPYSYQWLHGPAGQTWNGRTGGTDTLRITDANGCVAVDTALIQNIPGPQLTTTITAVSCYGGSDGSAVSSVSGTTGTYTYSWSDGPFNQSVRNDLPQGTFWIEVRDQVNCVDRDTFTIVQPTPLKMQAITPSQVLLCDGIPFTGTYTASGGNAGNQTFHINGTSGSQGYSHTQPGTFEVYATDVKGCYSDTIRYQLVTNPAISAVLSPDQVVCRFDSALYTCTASGGNGNYAYSWSPAVSGAANQAWIATTAGSYPRQVAVIVSDGCSAPDTAYAWISLHPDAFANVDLFPTEGCYPLSVKFTVSGNLDQFTVATTDGLRLGDTTSFSYLFTSEKEHESLIIGTTAQGCVLRANTSEPIRVHGYPVAGFGWNPDQPTTIDNLVYLENNSTGYNNSYEWSGTDPQTSDTVFSSTQLAPRYELIPEKGIYPVTLIASNQYGCRDSITKYITLKEEFTVYVPSSFTPDEDGFNDVFYPVFGADIRFYELTIFDRWGNELFHSSDPERGWDGTLQSNPCRPDVYPFKLSWITTESSVKQEISGRLNLVR
ncbi:MAG: T9SS type B sorting domain-containing protein [Bacteroidota bacterium]